MTFLCESDKCKIFDTTTAILNHVSLINKKITIGEAAEKIRIFNDELNGVLAKNYAYNIDFCFIQSLHGIIKLLDSIGIINFWAKTEITDYTNDKNSIDFSHFSDLRVALLSAEQQGERIIGVNLYTGFTLKHASGAKMDLRASAWLSNDGPEMVTAQIGSDEEDLPGVRQHVEPPDWLSEALSTLPTEALSVLALSRSP